MTPLSDRRRLPRVLAGALAVACLLGARARADNPNASLAVDPGIAVLGDTVSVNLTVTNQGGGAYGTGPSPLTATLLITSGAGLVTFVSGPYGGFGAVLGPNASETFTWTFSVVGLGTVAFTGQASGPVASSFVQVEASAVLAIPSPAPPAIQILGNVLRPGQVATIVVHGTVPGGTVTLSLYDQSGAPLGRVGDGPVRVDGSGFGSVRFDGTVRGRRLSTGQYWIAASGGASSKAPILILSR